DAWPEKGKEGGADTRAWGWADGGTRPGTPGQAGVGVVTVMDTPSAAQRPYAFVEGSDSHLWVRWWDGTSWHWADEGTPPGKTVKAGVGVLTVKDTPSAAQRPYAFVEGSDSHLWVSWWPATTRHRPGAG